MIADDSFAFTDPAAPVRRGSLRGAYWFLPTALFAELVDAGCIAFATDTPGMRPLPDTWLDLLRSDDCTVVCFGPLFGYVSPEHLGGSRICFS